MKRNYDTIAWIYDRFARLVFGRAQVNAQLYLLQAIPPESRILLVGGGTGWILEDIAEKYPSGISITYIDASAKMIDRARRRYIGNNKVTFINTAVEDTSLVGKFDVVLTPFLFDNFTEKSAGDIFSAIDPHLEKHGKWLYCDFEQTGSFWQMLILKMMYLFFGLCCGIKARRLPDMPARFRGQGYHTANKKTFIRGFISSIIYERISEQTPT